MQPDLAIKWAQQSPYCDIWNTHCTCWWTNTDWQAIPSDHCTEYSPFHHPELIGNYTAETMDFSPSPSATSKGIESLVHSSDHMSDINNQGLQVVDADVYNIAVNKCESLQNVYGCHWIPDSKISGYRCGDCPPICRSVDHTLTFIQFCIGAMLLKVSLPTGRISAVNILTDVADKDIQVRNSLNNSATG